VAEALWRSRLGYTGICDIKSGVLKKSSGKKF